jgi:LacI family transcriptional regulator
VTVRDELVRVGVHDADRAEAVVRELLALPDPPTAVFTANNRLTVGALKALHDEPVALVGFDDFELADLLGTTVVRHDSHRMGSHAAALAFDRLDGVARETRRVTLPTELVMRGSGEIQPP